MNKRKRSLALGLVTLTLLVWLGFGSLRITSLPGEARTNSGPGNKERSPEFARDLSAPSSAIVQLVRPTEVWPQIYEQLPDLPLENNYVSTETGEVEANNTLVGRLVRYHFYVKRRPPNFRFDWKLTLADYLGANELLQESVYPGYESLKENPMEGDRQAIQSLTREERNALVDVLVNVFSGNNAEEPASTPPTTETPENSTPGLPPLPKAGDADLLR